MLRLLRRGMFPEHYIHLKPAPSHALHSRHEVAVSAYEGHFILRRVHEFVGISDHVRSDARIDSLLLVAGVAIVHDDFKALLLGNSPQRIVFGGLEPR